MSAGDKHFNLASKARHETIFNYGSLLAVIHEYMAANGHSMHAGLEIGLDRVAFICNKLSLIPGLSQILI